MNKIGGVLTIVLTLLLISINPVFAQSNNSVESDTGDPIKDAYSCLSDIIDDKDQNSLSLQEAIFSTLSLGSEDKLKSVIAINKNSNNDCWPKSSCTLKDTAQVLLAYNRINKNTNDIQEWLLEQNDTASDLIWYLEIDITNHVQSECTLIHKETEKTITIKEDMTLTGNPGSCLSISPSRYWLQIKDSCIGDTFRISCDQDFITSLLYKNQGSSTIYVSSKTHSSSASGTTEETVNSQCFKIGNDCNYEGTLWAALALDHSEHSISSFLPYLIAQSFENKKLFPSTFLHIFTQGQDQYSEVVQNQIQDKYWEAPNTQYNKFYDTSLAMLSLQGKGSLELSNAQNYLKEIQTPEGCWNNNNIRDTAFILYSGWPDTVPGDIGTVIGTETCIRTGNSCISSLFACTENGGLVLDYECDFGVCCSASLQLESCNLKNGLLCSTSQTCSGTKVPSLEGSCCIDGACLETQTSNECEQGGGNCEAYCTDNEDTSSLGCGSSGDVCCISSTPSDNDSSNLWIWIILLSILILLVVLAIIYRKKLQMYFYKFKNKKKGPPKNTSSGPRRPPFPPAGRKMMRRRIPPNTTVPMKTTNTQNINKKPTKTDKELDETIKKLKEISK